MAGNIDERIVEMTFRGSSFVAEIRASVDALERLKSGLSSLHGSGNAINELDSSAKRFSTSGMINGIQSVTSHLSLMRIAGLAAFTSIVRQGLFAGEHLLAAFTIDPIKAGLASYETKINSIQTILANTASEGTNLKQVTDALNQLNIYSNKTVFNFADMAKNIGTFTAAGVKLNTSVASIKGIANLAALSGSSALQASTGMYQLSQAIAAGTVHLQDWNSVVTAGFGGKVFQNALINTARVQGVAVDAMIKKYGSFRQSLQSGWLSAKVLTSTLAQFTGDLSLKQIEAQGFTLKESEAIQKQAKIAVTSATQIRTISQLMAALKDDVSTAWASVFEAIIGNFSTAPKLLTSLFNTVSTAAIKPIYGLAALLTSFRKLGGFDLIIQTIEEAFHSLAAILGTVGAAFHEVFPSNGGGPAQGLIKIAIALQNFVQHLEPSARTLEEFKTIFVGVFSIFKIVIDVIGLVIKGFTGMSSSVGKSSGGILAFIAVIASWINSLRKALESGSALAHFFTFLGQVLALPAKALGAVIGYLSGLGHAASGAASGVGTFVQKIGQAFSGLAKAIMAGISSGNFNAIVGLLNQLIIGGILLKVKGLISSFGKNAGGGLFNTIKESFESLTGALSAMQAKLKADILEKIAIAIGLLVASLLVLSLINLPNLVKGISAITVMLTELLTAMEVAIKVGGSAGIVKMAAIGVALNLLASAILILSAAVAILAQFSWEQLAKGLGTIAGLLAALVGAASALSFEGPSIIGTAVALNLMAVALNLLIVPVRVLGSMDFGSLAKGIGAIAALLAILAGFNAISGVQLISTAAAMAVLGGALNLVALAVTQLGKLSAVTLVKGLLSVGLALGIIAVAMTAMPPTTIATAAGILLVATAMVVLSQALQTMGGMSWVEIAKSLIVLAGALAILAAAMLLSVEGLPGAAAILVMAAALAILTPVLIALGNLSWESIAKGLVTLVGVFVILAAAGIALTPVVPTLIALGIAIALLGVGILAAGAGVALFAVGLTALGVAVTTAGLAILSFVGNILNIIPATFAALGKGIIAFATAIGGGGAAILKALSTIFGAMFDAIARNAPKAGKAFEAVVDAMDHAIQRKTGPIVTTFFNMLLTLLNRTTQFAPRLTSAAANMIIAMINGIQRQVGRMANAATNLIIAFINTIGNDTSRVVTAGINMVIRTMNAIADSIRSHDVQMNAAGRNLGSAIVEGIISGIAGLAGGVFGAVENLASGAISKARDILRSFSPSREFIDIGQSIPQGMQVGIKNHTELATRQTEIMGVGILATIAKTMAGLNDAINSNLDLQPTITPVIDLTQAQNGLGTLKSLARNQSINVGVSATSAASISAANLAAAQAAGLAQASPGGVNLNFTQTNTSPKALAAVDIYRQTRNQLSVAKGALARANGGSGN